MARHYGIKARGLEIVARQLTPRQQIARALRQTGAAIVFKLKVWLGWRVR